MAFANATAVRDKGRADGAFISLKMAAVKIYKGSLVCIDASGYATYLPIASKPFAGVAYETVDNTSGSAGDKSVRVETCGVFSFIAASADQSWVGKEVWLDNSTSPINVVSTDPGIGPKIGRVTEVVSSSEVRVMINNYAFKVDAEAS